MYIDEKTRVFIDNLIDAFELLNIKVIPFGNDLYHKGIESIEKKLKEKYPIDYGNLQIAFIKKPLSGDFAIIDNIIMCMLNRRIFTYAPQFDRIGIIPKPNLISKPGDMYVELAKVFCEVTGTTPDK